MHNISASFLIFPEPSIVHRPTTFKLPGDGSGFDQGRQMRPICEEYAKEDNKFFEDFAKAWIKLKLAWCQGLSIIYIRITFMVLIRNRVLSKQPR
jgi:hypothetical protein